MEERPFLELTRKNKIKDIIDMLFSEKDIEIREEQEPWFVSILKNLKK